MQTYLGIELGSTRIKAVLIGPDMKPLATGAHDWENQMENGYWTYSLKSVWAGIQDSYHKMAEDFQAKTGEELTSIDAIGISAMMHGYALQSCQIFQHNQLALKITVQHRQQDTTVHPARA